MLDPFMGTGTTTVAAAKWGRNSIGVEIDQHYFRLAEERIRHATGSLFTHAEIKTEVNHTLKSSLSSNILHADDAMSYSMSV